VEPLVRLAFLRIAETVDPLVRAAFLRIAETVEPLVRLRVDGTNFFFLVALRAAVAMAEAEGGAIMAMEFEEAAPKVPARQ
tara:strand:+ start:1653 stop:1895 length:243 start_codon:yes stop_codon:yes gene_type:complete